MTTSDRIVIITPSQSIGCASRTIEIYARQLKKNGYLVRLFSLNTSPFTTITQYIDTHKVQVVLTNSIYYGADPQYTQAVEFLKFCNKRSIRVVDIAHFGKFDPVVDGLLSKRLFVSMTLLLKYILRAQKYGLGLEKYDYLYNPVAVRKNNKKIVENAGKTFVIGRIGRADKDKWDDSIIALAPLIKKQIPECIIRIQSMTEADKQKIPKSVLPYIEIIPEDSDREHILQTIESCDVLVQTSIIGESFGCAIAEGMALGKPIITNSTDFLAPVFFDRDNAQAELVQDGVNGFVENTPEKMARKIIELYNNHTLYQNISLANRIKAQTLFDATTLTKRLEGFLFNKNSTMKKLPLTLDMYKTRVKRETAATIIMLNARYLTRRIGRKLSNFGLLQCCQ